MWVAGPAEKSVDGAVRGAARSSGRGAMRLTTRALCGAARAAWRESFPLDGRDVARWFPGHMAKGEVWRDAAGPTLFTRLFAGRPRARRAGVARPFCHSAPEASVYTSALEKINS